MRTTCLVVIFFLVITVPVFWYWEGENFSDGAVCGTYALRLDGETSSLILTRDHAFRQELESTGTLRRAEGSWRISGEGHIAFSKDFLKVSGEEMSPAGQAYGQIENWFGLVSITLAPNPDGPRFHKKLFR